MKYRTRKFVFTAIYLSYLIGCSKNNGGRTQSEQEILLSSAFPDYHGASDTGNIPVTGGGASGTGTDNGGSTSGGTDTGGTSGGTTGGSSGGSDSGTIGSGGNPGTGGTSGGTTGGSSGGSDSGTIGSGGNPGTGGTSSGTTGGSSGGSDSGTIGSGGGSTPGDDGIVRLTPAGIQCSCLGKSPCACSNDLLEIGFVRVCSKRRSQDPHFIFFEEAKQPILSVELGYKESCTNGCGMAGAGLDANKKSILVQSIDLSAVDLLSQEVLVYVNNKLGSYTQVFGNSWRKVYAAIRICEDSNGDGRCTREPNYKHILSIRAPLINPAQFPLKLALQVWSGRKLTRAKNKALCEKQYSPLVLDLNRDGLLLSGPEAGVLFDLDDSGTPIRTGWIAGADDALLVRDINRNGNIDSGAELFGSATILRSGQRATNGFEALKDLDSNFDNLITKDDAVWSDLKLWLDPNRNAFSDIGELKRLEDYQMQWINLNYVAGPEIDINGNQTRERSTFMRRLNGTIFAGLIIDIWFATLIEWIPGE